MSVTVRDVMNLPCMKEAALYAGKSGLDNIVVSVSVLEFSEARDKRSEAFDQIYLGNELVITAFADIGDDTDRLCAEIEHMSARGTVGIILYYMGRFVGRLSKRVLDLADELGFVIIVMPPNQYHLRYSESISEIMHAIFMDQNRTANFVSPILETLGSLPQSQQNIDALLRILSDYLHITLILTDDSWHLMNYAAWPNMLEQGIRDMIDGFLEGNETERPSDLRVERLETDGPVKNVYNLLLSGSEDVLSNDTVQQVVSAIRILWKMSPEKPTGQWKDHDFIGSVLGNEPVRMRKQARLLHIDEKSIHNLLIFRQSSRKVADDQLIVETIREELSRYCRNIVVDIYSGDAVVLLDNGCATNWLPVLRELKDNLSRNGIQGWIVYACNLESMEKLRNAYLACVDSVEDTLQLFRRSSLLSFHEISFAKTCLNSINGGEDHLREKMQILRVLEMDDSRLENDLYETLAVFYFDAHMSISETASIMFVHPNTVKYRLKKISEKLGCSVTDMPEMLELYTAIALKRLLDG